MDNQRRAGFLLPKLVVDDHHEPFAPTRSRVAALATSMLVPAAVPVAAKPDKVIDAKMLEDEFKMKPRRPDAADVDGKVKRYENPQTSTYYRVF